VNNLPVEFSSESFVKRRKRKAQSWHEYEWIGRIYIL